LAGVLRISNGIAIEILTRLQLTASLFTSVDIWHIKAFGVGLGAQRLPKADVVLRVTGQIGVGETPGNLDVFVFNDDIIASVPAFRYAVNREAVPVVAALLAVEAVGTGLAADQEAGQQCGQ
jgi:hypothetical protein